MTNYTARRNVACVRPSATRSILARLACETAGLQAFWTLLADTIPVGTKHNLMRSYLVYHHLQYYTSIPAPYLVELLQLTFVLKQLFAVIMSKRENSRSITTAGRLVKTGLCSVAATNSQLLSFLGSRGIGDTSIPIRLPPEGSGVATVWNDKAPTAQAGIQRHALSAQLGLKQPSCPVESSPNVRGSSPAQSTNRWKKCLEPLLRVSKNRSSACS